MFLLLMAGGPLLHARSNVDEGRIQVVLRMVGHQVLLASGDSSSRIMPIVKDGDRYKIPLESDFHFVSADLVKAIREVMLETEIASSYRVEVEECDSRAVVYSFEVGLPEQKELIPCQAREHPTGCYDLMITLIGPPEQLAQTSPLIDPSEPGETEESEFGYLGWIIGFLILSVGLLVLRIKGKGHSPENGSQLSTSAALNVGNFSFNPSSMELALEENKTELTGKESELLHLFINRRNQTVKREEILNRVWGDEGGYVGRTLDVFVSRLRKKLEADPSIKIINIRGVGYKLVVEGMGTT
ncbi:winged helix-turn-helix transcriptional regulator [bacterium SCSIO 12741]|nr:winged helix-turn-helix transcriptional regulator [bacterium SCSIO 12741]